MESDSLRHLGWTKLDAKCREAFLEVRQACLQAYCHEEFVETLLQRSRHVAQLGGSARSGSRVAPLNSWPVSLEQLVAGAPRSSRSAGTSGARSGLSPTPYLLSVNGVLQSTFPSSPTSTSHAD